MSNNAMPLHYQITEELRKRLEAGEWEVGELFPTDKQLMEKYDVSSTTVRRAIYELVKEGWLSRKPGKGTYVKDKMVETLRNLTGFFEEIESKGMKPSARILNLGEIDVTEELLEATPELKEFGEVPKLFLIEKVHLMNDLPVVLVTSYWPVEIGYVLSRHDLTSKGMYEIIQKELKLTLEKAEQTISAAVANNDEARFLDINPGDPVLTMRRNAYGGGRLLEVSLNSYRSDRYSYRVTLDRNEVQEKTLFKLG